MVSNPFKKKKFTPSLSNVPQELGGTQPRSPLDIRNFSSGGGGGQSTRSTPTPTATGRTRNIQIDTARSINGQMTGGPSGGGNVSQSAQGGTNIKTNSFVEERLRIIGENIEKFKNLDINKVTNDIKADFAETLQNAPALLNRAAFFSPAFSVGTFGATTVGKGAQVGKLGIDVAFNAATRNVARRYATNPKSIALTGSVLGKIGLGMAAAGTLIGAISSYPFAGFIKEEALQNIGFGFNQAERGGNIEGMIEADNLADEILFASDSIMSKIPYANVLVQLKAFFKAMKVKSDINKQTIEDLQAERLAPPEIEGTPEAPEEKSEFDKNIDRLEERDATKQAQFEENTRKIQEGKTKTEPKSTLGFGLLKTGTELLEEKPKKKVKK